MLNHKNITRTVISAFVLIVGVAAWGVLQMQSAAGQVDACPAGENDSVDASSIMVDGLDVSWTEYADCEYRFILRSKPDNMRLETVNLDKADYTIRDGILAEDSSYEITIRLLKDGRPAGSPAKHTFVHSPDDESASATPIPFCTAESAVSGQADGGTPIPTPIPDFSPDAPVCINVPSEREVTGDSGPPGAPSSPGNPNVPWCAPHLGMVCGTEEYDTEMSVIYLDPNAPILPFCEDEPEQTERRPEPTPTPPPIDVLRTMPADCQIVPKDRSGVSGASRNMPGLPSSLGAPGFEPCYPWLGDDCDSPDDESASATPIPFCTAESAVSGQADGGTPVPTPTPDFSPDAPACINVPPEREVTGDSGPPGSPSRPGNPNFPWCAPHLGMVCDTDEDDTDKN